MARPALHFALQVLSVLAERERRRRRTLHQDIHLDAERRNRSPDSRTQDGSSPARPAETPGEGSHRDGTLRRRLQCSRGSIGHSLRQCHVGRLEAAGRRHAALRVRRRAAIRSGKDRNRSRHQGSGPDGGKSTHLPLERRNAQAGARRRRVAQQGKAGRRPHGAHR